MGTQRFVPGGDGQLTEKLAYDLSADVIMGSVVAEGLPELSMGERIALVAVCALTAAAPSAVLGELELELPVLADTMAAAAGTGRLSFVTRS